jgi:hypothetical protein
VTAPSTGAVTGRRTSAGRSGTVTLTSLAENRLALEHAVALRQGQHRLYHPAVEQPEVPDIGRDRLGERRLKIR